MPVLFLGHIYPEKLYGLGFGELSRNPYLHQILPNYTEDDYPEIEGLRKEVVRRRIRKLKMRLKFCTPQTCQKCAKMIVKDYNTPKKVF